MISDPEHLRPSPKVTPRAYFWNPSSDSPQVNLSDSPQVDLSDSPQVSLSGQWKDKYNKAREYLSKTIGEPDAKKELLEFTDNYLIENCAKKAIKDKNNSTAVHIQPSTTPDKHEAAISKKIHMGGACPEFPKGDDFYIKSAISSSGTSSAQNTVIDVEHGFLVAWGAVKDGIKVIVAPQKRTTEHDGYQLWHYEDGLLINKQTTLYLEPESVKAGSRLILHHRRSGSQSANQKWVLTKDGRIQLKDKQFVFEVKDKHVILAKAGKPSKNPLASQFHIMPLHPVKKGGAAIGVVRLELVGAKGLKGADTFLAGGKSDPYVRVFHVGNNKDIIAQTKVIDNNLNPVWNEVHYLPVKYIGEKFILDVMGFNTFVKDNPLGNCHLKITTELVKEVSDGVYEGTVNSIDVTAKLTIQGHLHYKAKFFPLEPFPKPTPNYLTNLKGKPFGRSTFYVLITLQAPNGGFPPSDILVNLFGFESKEQLLKLYKSHCCEERILKHNNHTVWTTSMILWFLRFLLKDYRSEWGSIYERAEQFISKEINDLEMEEAVVASGRKAVRERFDIDSKSRRITRDTISIAHVRRVLKCQQNTGAYYFTDNLAKSFGYENAEKLQTAFYEYRNSKTKSQKISQISSSVWATMMALYFYRYVAVDQKKEWFQTYERSYRWLWAQLKGNEALEQECFQIVKSFIKDFHGVCGDVVEMDRNFETEIADMIDSIKNPQKDRGIVQKPYGIARIEIKSARNLKQADSWLAGSASDPYIRISNFSTNWVYGDSRVIYNNCDPVWDQVFYIPVYDIHEKFNLQVFDYNAFFKHKLLGFYILDLKNIIKELPNGSYEGKKLKLDANLTYKGSNRGQFSFVAGFFSLPESDQMEAITINNGSIQHLYLLMTYQSQYGYFELTDSLAKLFNFNSKEELAKAFSDFVQKDEGVRNLDNRIWATVLVTSFLKVLLWKERREWVNVYNRAESWLSENVPDVEVEERLYNYSNKFVIHLFKATQWADENQQRSLGILVISKQSIITLRHVDIRVVRRFLSYQNESGCFELTPQLAKALGFSSVKEANKYIETHFLSYSPRLAQFNPNIWSTAIMTWFIRYVLVDFRNEWVGSYQKAQKWLCQQVPDEKVREELLEAARIFVVKRFEVEPDAISEDESFKESIEANEKKREIVEEHDEEEQPIPNDEVVGIIRICVKDAKNLKKSDSWFTFANPDPYIRIMDAAGNEIVRTKVNHGTINPKWNEVHLLSAHGCGEKISFEIFDENLFIADKPLGTYVLDTTILLKSEDQSKPLSGSFPLQIGQKPVRGQLNLDIQFFPISFTEGENFEFSKDTIKQQHLYMLISWRHANGSWEFTDKLARFFNYKSAEELKQAFLAHLTSSDKDLLKYDLSILATALTIMYLKVLCWKHYGEWKRIVANSESWLSKEINNIDCEDRLYDLCRKFIVERFKVKNFEKEQLEIIEPAKQTIITRKVITIRHVRTLLSHQSDDGCIELNEKVAEFFGFKSVDEFKQHLEKHFKTERVNKLHHNAWVTACVVWYLRLVALDHRHEWIGNYEKSSEWLKKLCKGDTALESEINDCAKKFIISRYEVDNDAIEADTSFIAAIKTKDAAIAEEKNEIRRRKKGSTHRKTISLSGNVVNRNTTTDAVVKKFITYRPKDSCYSLNDEIAKHLGFYDKASLESALRSHFISDNLSKLDIDTLLSAVGIWYLRLLGVDHRDHWSGECDELYKLLHSRINNPQIERELLGSAKQFIIRSYNVEDDAIQKDDEYQEHLNRTSDIESCKTFVIDKSDKSAGKKLEAAAENIIPRTVEAAKKDANAAVKDVKNFFGGLYEAASKLGDKVEDKVEDALTFDKNKHDDHEKAEALIVVEQLATPEKCNEVVSDQKDDGCIELGDSVCNELDAPKEEIITTIQKKIKNNKLKSPELLSSLGTAINISYLKKAAPQHESLWKDKYDKARKYLSQQIGDAEAEKELLKLADDYVVENSIKKVIKNKKRNAVSNVRNLATPEKCNDALSKQKDDGSFEISETVCEEIDVPIVDVVPTVKKSTQHKKLRSPESEPWWKTALTLSYLKIAAPHHKKLWEDKYNKARDYLSKQIGDKDAEKELLDCTDKYVVDNVTKKYEKDQKKTAALPIVREKVSPEKHKEIVSKQNDDGCIELDDSVCKELGVPKEEVITTIRKKIKNNKLKSPEHSSSLATAINISYLKNAAPHHEGSWKEKYDKAREYLSKQIGDKDAEEELIKCTDEYVVDKVTEKVIEEKKRDVIDIKKEEIPKSEKGKSFFGGLYETPKSEKGKSFFGGVYETVSSKIGEIGDHLEDAFSVDKDKHDDHEKAEALVIVEESATPEKCKEIVSNQKDDGCIELGDSVCNELDAPKDEIITSIQKNIKNDRLKAPERKPSLETAVNLAYLKKAASQYGNIWNDKYNKAREYLSKQIGDSKAEKELLDLADDYVVENSIKKVIKDKKRNAVAKARDSATPEKCNDIVSKQKDDGSFEINETICEEIEIPLDVVPVVKKCTQNEKLKSPESEPWWKTAITLSYLKIAAPHHKKLWEDKYNKARDYLSKQIGDKDAEKELLNCTDKYVVDNATKKFEKDHKKDVAITIIREEASPEKCEEIVSKQNDNGCIELDDSVCNELDTPKEEVISAIQKKVKNNRLKLPERKPSLETAINISYLKNTAPHHEDLWKEKYDKAREYLSNEIGDKNAEEELIKCADEYVMDKITDKVIEEKKRDVIDLKEHEIPKKPKGFFGGIYELVANLGGHIERALGFKRKLNQHEKAEALVIVEETATPEKCKEIIAKQHDDGSIELGDSVCNELDVPKEEIITTIQKNIKNAKLQSPEHSSSLATAINLAYLKKAASRHEGLWRDKYNAAREYLTKEIGDANAEQELLDFADDFVIENATRKVVKDKRRNSVDRVQKATTPEKCNDAVSEQNNDGSFEISETVCKELDVPITDIVNTLKNDTQNEKFKSPESEPWWKTALTLSYLRIAAPHHKKLWGDKYNQALDYLSKQIGDAAAEELLDCTDKYVVDNFTNKVEKDHKKDIAIAVVQEAASPDKHKEIVSQQKDDGCIELDDSVCNELGAPKEEIITTIQKKVKNNKLKSPEHSSSLATAINLSYLKNAAAKYEGEWRDKYNKAREYLSKQIGDKDAEKELIECADEYVIDKTTNKVIEEKNRDVIELKKDEIPKAEKAEGKSFFGGLYEKAAKL
ncbi:9875_t:CDS:10, partial [Dentiscutata erythropus]